MQDKENEQHYNHLPEDKAEGPFPQIPSTLLPNVLQCLGLTPGLPMPTDEVSIDDLLKKLKSKAWEERAAAVRALGKRETAIPIALFPSLLHDEDPTVRAIAVHVLGNMGQHTPLHWLIEALQDPDWHVREVSVLALGQQGERIPQEILMTALQDSDGSVREATNFALHHHSSPKMVLYEQLKEKPSMQHERPDHALLNGRRNRISTENEAHIDWNGALFEDRGNSSTSQRVQEQAQVYAAQEYIPPQHRQAQSEIPSYAYAEVGAGPTQGEKITSYRLRRKSRKAWWIATLIITAILFLELGRLSTVVVPSPHFAFTHMVDVPSKDWSGAVSSNDIFPFDSSPYASIMQDNLSKTLNLTPQQIQEKMKQHDGVLEAIAAEQNIPANQLHDVELNSLKTILDLAVNRLAINQQDADQLMQRFQKEPELRNKASIALLDPIAHPKDGQK